MQANPFVDALLFLAVALSSKRRPAELVEIIAAIDLAEGAQGIVPSGLILSESFQRLSKLGLVIETEGHYSLTTAAQSIFAGLPRKAATPERLTSLKDQIVAFTPTAEHPTIMLTSNQLGSAILAHRAAGKNVGKNLLVPKPNAADNETKPGQRQRKPFPGRRRKD